MSEFGFRLLPAKARSGKGWLVLLAVPVVLIAAVVIWAQRFAPPPDFAGSGSGEVTVAVAKGDTLTEIGRTLSEAGVVASTEAWVAAVSGNEEAAKIGPGDYVLRLRMSARSALELMLDPESRAFLKLVVREGDRLSEVVGNASKLTGIAKDEFYAALRQPKAIGLASSAKGSPEGFLFPATYEITDSDTAITILKKMTTRWKQAAAELELERRARAAGHSVLEIMTIASILEVESAPADYAKVARVIENRLALPMRLQLDSTVNYALGLSALQLSSEQLATESEFNTYRVDGLPPTPIGNPGAAAIEAALEPVPGPWLYFVTVDPDTKLTKFAVTYEEFLVLKEEFKANVG